MALVPEDTYKKWFKKDSFVRKNFDFLFVNPLWDTEVPSRFSLCPYFWMAMFSLFIFRPFVYLLLGFMSVVKLLRLGALINKTDRFFSFLGRRPATGAPTVLGLILTAIVSGICYVGYHVFLNYVEVGVPLLFILPVALLATLLICGIYIEKNQHNSERCKVEYYARFVALISLVLGVIFHSAEMFDVAAFMANALSTAFGGILGLIAGGFKFIWSSVVYVWDSILSVGVNGAKIAAVSVIGMLCYGYAVYRFGSFALKTTEDNSKITNKEFAANLKRITDELYLNSVYSRSECELFAAISSKAYALANSEPNVLISQEQLDEIKAEMDAWVAKRREVKRGRLQKCEQVANAVGRAFLMMVSPVVWTWRVIRPALSYAKALIKARKEGVCPLVELEK